MFIVNTISVFLHWFKPIASWMFLFVVSKIALLICPNLFFAGFMSLTVGLLLKFSLWSFRVIKLLFSPSISNGFSTSLFLKIFFPSILICFFMLLPVFFYFKVMAFFCHMIEMFHETLLTKLLFPGIGLASPSCSSPNYWTHWFPVKVFRNFNVKSY